MVSSILSTCPSCQHHPCHDHSKCVQTLSNVSYRQKCSGWEAMSWGFGSERGRFDLGSNYCCGDLRKLWLHCLLFAFPHYWVAVLSSIKMRLYRKQLLRSEGQETAAAAIFHATEKFVFARFSTGLQIYYPWPLRSKQAKMLSQVFSISTMSSQTPPQSPADAFSAPEATTPDLQISIYHSQGRTWSAGVRRILMWPSCTMDGVSPRQH